MSHIEFEIGGKYENMKGIYEVISMSEETMQIRWENGEEVTTDIDFQRRIIERMEFEERLRVEKKAKKARKASGGRVKFEGLQDSDFSGKVSGTIWRRRSCLGGAVKVVPNSSQYDVKSWSIARKPMVQWADVSHRNPDIFNLQSKFFVRLDDDELYCGYCIERPGKIGEKQGDWDSLIEWLMEGENEKRLMGIVSDRNMKIYQVGKEGEITWKIHTLDEKWLVERKGEEAPLDKPIGDFLKDFSESGANVDLQIAKTIEKEEAVSKGIDIADDISLVFESLFPLYEGTSSNAGTPS